MKSTKPQPKKAIAKRRATPPEIYVRIAPRHSYLAEYAKASIRVKAGEYQYLTWRDGKQVRTFYLGRKNNS